MNPATERLVEMTPVLGFISTFCLALLVWLFNVSLVRSRRWREQTTQDIRLLDENGRQTAAVVKAMIADFAKFKETYDTDSMLLPRIYNVVRSLQPEKATTAKQPAQPAPVTVGTYAITPLAVSLDRLAKNVEEHSFLRPGPAASASLVLTSFTYVYDSLRAIDAELKSQQPAVRCSPHVDIDATLSMLATEIVKINDMGGLPTERARVISETLVSVINIVRDLNNRP